MIPILYTPDEREFLTNGLGLLAEATDCVVEWRANSTYELELCYPVEGRRFAQIQKNCIILAQPDPDTREQPFRVYRVGKEHRGIVTYYARHVAYDCIGVPVAPFAASTAMEATLALGDNAVIEHPFTITTEHPGTGELKTVVPLPLWTILGQMLTEFGGEWEFDRWDITLKTRLGEDRGVSIRYGKNLATLEQDENISNCYTAVYPYWSDGEGDLVQLPERVIAAPGEHDHVRVLTLPLEFDVKPTEEELRAATVEYMEKHDIGAPEISWKIGFVPLEQVEEYRGKALLNRIRRGDGVTVVFPKLGINATARAVQTRYKPLLDRFESITLGSVKQTIADTIVSQQKQIMLNQAEARAGWAAATEWLTNGKGYKVERRDASGNTIDTLYMDTPDIKTAVNVLRIGQSGIGFSHSGVDGPYVSAWTLDGQLAADSVNLTGKFAIYRDGVLQGYMGYMEGSAGGVVTTGVCVSDAAGECYAIATELGVRLQAGSASAYLEKDGSFVVNGKAIG